MRGLMSRPDRSRRGWTVPLAFLLVAAVGCGSVAPTPTATPPPDTTSFLPLDVGNRWEYQAQIIGGDSRITVSVDAVCAINEGERRTQYVLVVTCDGTAVGQLEYVQSTVLWPIKGEVMNTVSRNRDGQMIERDPPERLLRYSMTVGQMWDWEGQIGDVTRQSRYIVASRGRVLTPAGEFDALRVLSIHGQDDRPVGSIERWYAPGVGLVRESARFQTPGQSGQMAMVELTRNLREFRRVDVVQLDCCVRMRAAAQQQQQPQKSK